jgi:hypothetical protein
MDLFVNSGGGATSCLSVRLHDACVFFEKYNKWPDTIDSSTQFEMFQTEERIDFSKYVFNTYQKPFENEFINFNHGWQYGWYNKIDIASLSILANKICPLSNEILEKSNEFFNRCIGRGSVLYRGNDKCKEVSIVPYDLMLKMAKESKVQKWVVQTDELEFYSYWKENFPDTIRIEEIPMISKNSDSYVMPENRKDFLVNFIAALRAISMTETLLTTTGNTGLWACLFRGNTKNVYQSWGGHKNFKKLN